MSYPKATATNSEVEFEGTTVLISKNSNCANYENDKLFGICDTKGNLEILYENNMSDYYAFPSSSLIMGSLRTYGI